VNWGLLLLLLLLLCGMPLFCLLAAIGLLGLYLGGTTPLAALADVFGLAGDRAVALTSIPLFTFTGYLMAKAKTAERLVALAESLLGWVPGGLALLTLWLCAFFTVFTGASGVTIAALGGLLLPKLGERGYPERSSLGVVTGSGAVGLLFPPALPLIVYGVVFALNAGQAAGVPLEFSFDRFLFAGILPGLLLLVILSAYCVLIGWRHRTVRSPLDLRRCAHALRAAKWEVPIPFVVVGLLAGGLVTVHEVAPLVALYVFVIEVCRRRSVSMSIRTTWGSSSSSTWRSGTCCPRRA
jgi:tripartite ATP-independent transporter DctM subunit